MPGIQIVNNVQCKNIVKIFTGPTYKLLLSLTVISDVCRSFISNKTAFAKYCLTQWISKLPGNFDIHAVRQYLVNITGLADIVYATVYKTEPIFTCLEHGKLSKFQLYFEFQFFEFQTLNILILISSDASTPTAYSILAGAHSLTSMEPTQQRKQVAEVSHFVYDDVMIWKHLTYYWPFVGGIHRWPISPHKEPVLSSDVSFVDSIKQLLDTQTNSSFDLTVTTK